MSGVIFVYGGLTYKNKAGETVNRYIMTLCPEGKPKLAKKTAKSRKLSAIQVTDAVAAKKLSKILKDGYDKKKKFLRVPFAGAPNFLTCHKLAKGGDILVDEPLTKKAVKRAIKAKKAA